MMTFPTEWKVIKFMFQTTNQMGIPGKISQGDSTKIGAPRYPNRPKPWPKPADKNVEELILDKRKRCVKC
jgi:hypothetical protein